MKDLRAPGYYCDPLMLHENFSWKLDSLHNSVCYVRRCEGLAELLLEIQGVEPALRYAKIFRAYQLVVAKRSPLLMVYGLKQESQFRLHQQLGAHLSRTVSFEEVDKTIPGGDGRKLLPPNPQFKLEQ